ncbi:MAG: hypothetical protein AAFO07_24960 [Bacteroidota bacterium]
MKLITYPLLVFFCLMVNAGLFAQNATSVLKDFKIVIEKDGNKIIMECEKGCAWLKLTYNNDLEEQPIDQNGMANNGHIIPGVDSKIAHFLFNVSKTDKGVSFKGITGTAWTALSFSLKEGEKRAFDQNGTSKIE